MDVPYLNDAPVKRIHNKPVAYRRQRADRRDLSKNVAPLERCLRADRACLFQILPRLLEEDVQAKMSRWTTTFVCRGVLYQLRCINSQQMHARPHDDVMLLWRHRWRDVPGQVIYHRTLDVCHKFNLFGQHCHLMRVRSADSPIVCVQPIYQLMSPKEAIDVLYVIQLTTSIRMLLFTAFLRRSFSLHFYIPYFQGLQQTIKHGSREEMDNIESMGVNVRRTNRKR